jgi:uncharacterized protein (TIGR03083 family)
MEQGSTAMTTAAVDALRADHRYLTDIAATFTAEEWAAQSGCPGWSVQDLVAHMTQLFKLVTDPASLPELDPAGTEATQERYVAALRGSTPEEVLAAYWTLGEQAVAGLELVQGVEDPLDMGDLGTHPLHLGANAFAFDHYTHIRVDLLAPTGPIERPAPPTTETHLDATADWIIAALPQMTPEAVVAPIELRLVGPAGRTVRFGPDDGADPVATITSSIDAMVRWATGRADGLELVEVDGDEAAAKHFLEHVHVA